MGSATTLEIMSSLYATNSIIAGWSSVCEFLWSMLRQQIYFVGINEGKRDNMFYSFPLLVYVN